MSQYGFDPRRAIWSIPWFDSSENASTNCKNYYQDYARATTQDELISAILGGVIGNWDNIDPYTDGLPCSQTEQNQLFPVPYVYSTAPDAIDAHIYPALTSGTPDSQTQTTIQAVANTDYGDIPQIFSDVQALQGATIIIGETYWGSLFPGWDPAGTLCWQSPTSSPAGNVLGFNQSALATSTNPSYSVVFRPFMDMEDSSGSCFTYGNGTTSTATYPSSQTSFQNVNLGAQGPYVPTGTTVH